MGKSSTNTISLERHERDILAMVEAAYPVPVHADQIARLLNEHTGIVETVLRTLHRKGKIEVFDETRWRKVRLP